MSEITLGHLRIIPASVSHQGRMYYIVSIYDDKGGYIQINATPKGKMHIYPNPKCKVKETK